LSFFASPRLYTLDVARLFAQFEQRNICTEMNHIPSVPRVHTRARTHARARVLSLIFRKGSIGSDPCESQTFALDKDRLFERMPSFVFKKLSHIARAPPSPMNAPIRRGTKLTSQITMFAVSGDCSSIVDTRSVYLPRTIARGFTAFNNLKCVRNLIFAYKAPAIAIFYRTFNLLQDYLFIMPVFRFL
jgi:hypothetical protein